MWGAWEVENVAVKTTLWRLIVIYSYYQNIFTTFLQIIIPSSYEYTLIKVNYVVILIFGYNCIYPLISMIFYPQTNLHIKQRLAKSFWLIDMTCWLWWWCTLYEKYQSIFALFFRKSRCSQWRWWGHKISFFIKTNYSKQPFIINDLN